MAAMLAGPVLLVLVVILLSRPILTAAGSSNLAASGYSSAWVAGHATWYGDPYGEGSSGGACGYTQLKGSPYGVKIAAGSGVIFQKGQGCGQCYDVMCSDASLCSTKPTRIVITDECPGGTYCSTGEPAFDFSGAAISSMALPGKDQMLRNKGLYDIQYKRAPCTYPKQNIAFQMDAGSTNHWISFIVKYQGGPGDIASVAIRQAGKSSFEPMQHNWGANWMAISYSGKAFQGPFDVQITAKLNGHTLIASEVIPQNFQPGVLYNSNVQFAY